MICSLCKADLPLSNFQLRTDSGTYRKQCKACRKSYRKSHYENNKIKYSEMSKRYYADNREACSTKRAEYYMNNKESFRIRSLNWREKYPEKYRSASRRSSKAFRDTEYGKFRQFIRGSMRRVGKGLSVTCVGYDFKKFVSRIEYNFKPGMTWENYGEWEIDHIKPIIRFYNQGVTDPRLINALCNLRPLWVNENRSKSSKFILTV